MKSDLRHEPLPAVAVLSPHCTACAALYECGVRSPAIRTTPYRSVWLCWGGDFMLLHTVFGCNGPNAGSPCHICLIGRDSLRSRTVPANTPPRLRSLAAALQH